MVNSAINFVYALTWIYTLLIFVYVLLSWVQLGYNLWLGRFRTFLHDTVEPYLGLFRRMLPSFGGLDLSPMIAVIVLWVVSRVVIVLLDSFA